MRELVSLLNVFCLLSLLAVGGGSAVLPQMEHETVTVHQWVSADDFATIYSLGQMAPGGRFSALHTYPGAGRKRAAGNHLQRIANPLNFFILSFFHSFNSLKL